MWIDFAITPIAVAIRYQFDGNGTDELREILEEKTTVNIVRSENDLQLVQPYDSKKAQHQTFYQPRNDRSLASIGNADRSQSSPDGFSLPALFRTGNENVDAWIMLKETGLDGSYPAVHISSITEEGFVSFGFPFAQDGNAAMGSRLPHSTLPWNTPWRIVTLSTSLDDLIKDTSVTDLAQVDQIYTRTYDDSFIKPGSASWNWYANASNTMSFTATKAYIDLASKYSWPYSLLDAGWDQMVDDDGRNVTLEEISEYARSKNVRLWVWMNTAGPNNDADVTPRDRLYWPDIRRPTMKWLSDLGIAGIKVDGIESEKQEMIQYLLDILGDAAEFRLMIVFHNCPVPHGWERTWPNLISSEGLVTSEYYTNSHTAYAPQMPENNVNEAFLRLTIGPADYAPGTFSQSVNPFDAPLTTYAHEMALHIVIDSGLRCFPEAPETYYEIDDSIMTLLSNVPFVWEETRFVDGEPGKFIVLAKRVKDLVYFVGINGETSYISENSKSRDARGEARTLNLDMHKILNVKVAVELEARDIAGSRQVVVTNNTGFDGRFLTITMEPFGGFVLLLRTLQSTPSLEPPWKHESKIGLELFYWPMFYTLLFFTALSLSSRFVRIGGGSGRVARA